MTKEIMLGFQETELPKKEEKSKFYKIAHKFYYSYWYLFTCAILAAIAWKVGIPDVAFVPVIVLISIQLLLFDDVFPFIPAFFMLTMSIGPGATPDNMIYLAGYIAIAIIPVIYHFTKFKPNKTCGKFFKPQLVISIVLILGGLGSTITPEHYIMGLPQGIALGVGALALYLLIINYTKTKEYDFQIYFAKSFTALGICLILLQIMIMFFNPQFTFEQVLHKHVDTGAMLSNNMATFYLLTMPFAFYLAVKIPSMTFIHLALGTLQFLGCVFTYSVGGIIFGVIEFICCVVYSICVSKDFRWRIITSYFMILGILLIIYACCFDVLNDRIHYILGRMHIFDIPSDNVIEQGYGTIVSGSTSPGVEVPVESDITRGRFDLYKESWGVFKMFPAFGAGLGYTSPSQVGSAISFFMFHSTFFQIIACLGIVGLLGYIYYYWQKIKIVFKGIKKNIFQAFILFAFIGFEGYSMIDCGVFIPMPFAFMTIFMMMSIELGNKQIKEKEELEKFKISQIA